VLVQVDQPFVHAHALLPIACALLPIACALLRAANAPQASPGFRRTLRRTLRQVGILTRELLRRVWILAEEPRRVQVLAG
jgi:hypothetical protein